MGNRVTMPGITVPGVFKAMNIEPRPEWTWAVGDRLQKMYASEFGTQPPKELRTKTAGGGSHCFAVYPYEWFDRIKGVIAVIAKEGDSQQALFDE